MADTQEQQVVAPQPGTPEYDAAMAAKVDENAAKAVADAAGEPLKAPEGDDQQEPPKADESAEKEGSQEDQEEAPEDAAKEAVESVGVDYDALQTEFDEKGELSPESYEKLQKVGFPKEVVDSYIAGQAALAAQFEAQGVEAAGGQQQFDQMREWAATSMSKGELEAYNKAITGTQEEMLQAVRGLRSRYEAEVGRQPRLLGGAPTSGTNQGYNSRAEMTAEMRDPRYAKDPAFRAKVANKIAATTAF